MIYIYRILWLVFYIPVFAIEIALFALSIPMFFTACLVYFIKCGDIEQGPDWCLPGNTSLLFNKWYNKLLIEYEAKQKQNNTNDRREN